MTLTGNKKGILPWSIETIFQFWKTNNSNYFMFKVGVAFYEIYNDKIYDLF